MSLRGSEIVVVKRLRLADGETMAIETLHIPEALVPGLSSKSLTGSFYDLLRDGYGITIASGTQAIEPTVTNDEESAALGVPLHSPAFLFERTSRDASGRTVEFVQSIYRGDRYRIVTELGRQRASLSAPFTRTARHPLDTGGLVCEPPRVAIWYRPIGVSTIARALEGHRGIFSAEVPRRRLEETLHETTNYRGGGHRSPYSGSSRRPRAPAASRQQANKLTVWLQVDAQSGWPDRRRGRQSAVPERPPRLDASTSSTRTGATTSRSSTPRSPATPRRT